METTDFPPSSDAILPSSPISDRTDNPAIVPKSKSDPATTTDPTPDPRLAALSAKQSVLLQTLSALDAERNTLAAQAKLPSGLPLPENLSDEDRTKHALSSANAVIKEHIALLHRYNEIKDIGQGLMGLIADKRGTRVVGVMEEFGMGEKD